MTDEDEEEGEEEEEEENEAAKLETPPFAFLAFPVSVQY